MKSKTRTLLLLHRDRRAGGTRNVYNIKAALSKIKEVLADSCGRAQATILMNQMDSDEVDYEARARARKAGDADDARVQALQTRLNRMVNGESAKA